MLVLAEAVLFSSLVAFTVISMGATIFAIADAAPVLEPVIVTVGAEV